MITHFDRDAYGLPARAYLAPNPPPCRHPETRQGHPIVKDNCVNVPDICTTCRRHVAVTSYTKDAWIHHQMKRIVTVQQASLFNEREAD